MKRFDSEENRQVANKQYFEWAYACQCPHRESQTSRLADPCHHLLLVPPLAIGWEIESLEISYLGLIPLLPQTGQWTAHFQPQDQPFYVPSSSHCSGLLCLWVVLGQIPAWFLLFYIFAYTFTFFHQQSFISKVNPEEVVHQEFCDFFLLCLQPELLNGSALHSKTHWAAALLLAQGCKAISLGSLRMEESWMAEGQLTILSSNPMLPASYTRKAAQWKVSCYPEIPGCTHQPSIPSLKAAVLSQSGGCLGQGQLGRDVEWLLCPYTCFGAAPKAPAQINSPVTPSFVNRLLSTCSEI